MSGKFKNSWSRIERATKHLATFVEEWRTLGNDHVSTVARYDKDSGWFIASAVLSEKTIEGIRNNTLALELGEYAYQLRAALDGLIWDAITFSQNGTEPPTDANRVEFPILRKPADFKNCAFLRYPFPDKLKVWLESIQPYAAVQPEGHPDRGVPTALFDIHDLARFDRHRRLRIIAAVPTQLRFGIVSEPPSKIVARERIDTCDLFGGNYEFLRFKAETIDGTEIRKMRLKTEISFEVLLEDIEPFEGMDAGIQLRSYIGVVEHISGRFEEAFP